MNALGMDALVGDIFVLSHYPDSMGRCTPALCTIAATLRLTGCCSPVHHCCLAKARGYLQSKQGCSLITWLWWPGGLAFLGFIRDTVLYKLQPPRQCTDSRLKHTPSPSVKNAYLLVLDCQPEQQTSGFLHIYRLSRKISQST